MKHLSAITTLSLVGLIGLPSLPAYSQSRSERVDQITNALSGAINTRATPRVIEQRASPGQLMRETLTEVDFDEMPAKLALDIWQNQTQVPLVINWKALEVAGIDPTTPITLKLNKVPADVVLKLIIGQMNADVFDDDRLLVDVERWFVRVMTKRDALRRSKTRVYFIGDLLMDIPNFTNAPGFDLNEALSNTNSGGSTGGGNRGGGGGGGGLFFDDADQVKEEYLSKEEKADRIMDLIRSGIEPDIWQANGGEYASMRYMRGMLVVKAPEFVHRQIGVPFQGSGPSTARSTATQRSSNSSGNKPVATGGNVAGKAPKPPQLLD